MARIASQSKMGYYKTPSHLLPIISSYLSVEEANDTVIFDPCCGTGEAVSVIGEELDLSKGNIFGNELDNERFLEASNLLGLNQVTFGDAISSLRGNSGVSILYENPPYDNEGNFEGRTEYKFLNSHYRFLKKEGIIVFVIPLYVLRTEEAQRLPIWFKDLRVFRFPEDDFTSFKQVVVFGRKSRGMSKREAQSFQEQIDFPRTLSDSCDVEYIAPSSAGFRLSSREIHEDQVLSYLPNLKKELSLGIEQESKDSRIQSLMTLRAGHQALLLGSGGVNGAYWDPNGSGNMLIVKGVVTTVTTTVEEETEGGGILTKETSRPVSSIRALDISESRKQEGVVVYEYK